ncbi:anthrone oxygenase family protein [Nocardioides sp. 503]|uniref:anthrone oxygenase family protein n=1 Tax=Nocardioides sp. 503 TaxID=2508326 RepID=UPI001ADA27C4|nr:anthrone oxygenase family protein [Nocardioides sp. 503]
MIDVLEPLRGPLLLGATLTAGLQAGTYYTWASGVMPGLARVDDQTFVHAVQEMNVAIVNPVFMASFLGAPVLAVAAALAVDAPVRPWALAAAGLALATFVITVAGNVPLNDALAETGVRADFETAWVRLNALRAVTSTASLACLAWAAWRS